MRKHMGRTDRGTTQIPVHSYREQALIRRNVLLRPELLNRTAPFTDDLHWSFFQAAPVGISGRYLNLKELTADDSLSL